MREFREILIDDLDGSEAHDTIPFSVKGVDYEVDLSDKNVHRFYQALGPFMEAGRRVKRTRQPRRRTSAVRVDHGLARAWARSVGMEVEAIGAVPEDVQRAYLTAWLAGEVPEEYS